MCLLCVTEFFKVLALFVDSDPVIVFGLNQSGNADLCTTTSLISVSRVFSLTREHEGRKVRNITFKASTAVRTYLLFPSRFYQASKIS